MGLIKAFSGAIGGTFADQWKDFLMPKPIHVIRGPIINNNQSCKRTIK